MISLNRNILNVKLNERKLHETSSEKPRIKRRTSKLQLLQSSSLILLEVPDNSVIEVGLVTLYNAVIVFSKDSQLCGAPCYTIGLSASVT
jgi:hypothetical protein